MRKFLLLIGALLAFSIGAWAQIPAEVTDVMNRCRTAMTNPSGLEYEMDMKVGMGPLSMKMHFVVADKCKLNRTSMSMKVMGADIVAESGFDGADTWEVEDDTITITHGDVRKKSKGEIGLDIDKKYHKAKMKLKDGYYEITFSEPKDKDNEAKSITVTIWAKSYTLRDMRTSSRGAKVTMTVTKIRVGLRDSYFKLDLSQYPNAVVIRK